MAYGPLEYYIIGFPKNNFTGEIAPALKKAVDSGAIRIVDLVFVHKDAGGTVTQLEYQDFDSVVARVFAALDPDGEGLFSGEDLDEIGAGLDNDSAAALVLVEHLWAAQLREATVKAGGRLIDHGILTEDVARSLEHATA